MPSQENIHNQQELLHTSRATLATLLKQEAQHTSALVPPATVSGIYEARQRIARAKTALRGWGIDVDDEPDDEAPDNAPPPRPIPSHQPSIPVLSWPRMSTRLRWLIIAGGIVGLVSAVISAWFLGKAVGEQSLASIGATATVQTQSFQMALAEKPTLVAQADAVQRTVIAVQRTAIAEEGKIEQTIITLSPTPQPIFFENFQDKRPDASLYLIDTGNESTTVTLINQGLGARVKSFCCWKTMYTVKNNFKDFDLTVTVDSIVGVNMEFITFFRNNRDKWQQEVRYRFEIDVNGSAKPSYSLSSETNGRPYNINNAGIDAINVHQVEIICRQDMCNFLINAQEVYKDIGFRNITGNIIFAVSGDGEVRVRDITIKPLN